ncbi:MAG: thioether cross-link-forming SCIFF peptide maturase [Clostridia bacterium]
MIHAFKALGKNILMDVESGAIHVLDDAAFLVACALEEGKDPYETGASTEETKEILLELDEIKKNGEFMSPPPEIEELPFDDTIKSMCLHVAHDCNLRCKYCFAGTGEFHGERSMMSVETARRALDFLIAHSKNRQHLEVDLFGGEPLMNMDVVREAVAYGRELEKKYGKKINFTMTTNGVLLNDETIEFLNREMYNIVISIDGRKSVNDAVRTTVGGGSAYDVIVKNAKKLVDGRNGEYYIRGTFTNKNLDFAKDVEAIYNLGFDQISIEPVVLGENDSLAIRKENLEQIFAEYDKLLNMIIEYGKQGKFINFFHFMVDLTHSPCLKKRLKGCGAGVEYVSVTPDGEIYPCHQFAGENGFAMGNVFDDTIDNDLQKKFHGCNILTKPKCKECFAKYFCSGGCAANAYRYEGDINHPHEISCALMRKRAECAIAKFVYENI